MKDQAADDMFKAVSNQFSYYQRIIDSLRSMIANNGLSGLEGWYFNGINGGNGYYPISSCQVQPPSTLTQQQQDATAAFLTGIGADFGEVKGGARNLLAADTASDTEQTIPDPVVANPVASKKDVVAEDNDGASHLANTAGSTAKRMLQAEPRQSDTTGDAAPNIVAPYFTPPPPAQGVKCVSGTWYQNFYNDVLNLDCDDSALYPTCTQPYTISRRIKIIQDWDTGNGLLPTPVISANWTKQYGITFGYWPFVYNGTAGGGNLTGNNTCVPFPDIAKGQPGRSYRNPAQCAANPCYGPGFNGPFTKDKPPCVIPADYNKCYSPQPGSPPKGSGCDVPAPGFSDPLDCAITNQANQTVFPPSCIYKGWPVSQYPNPTCGFAPYAVLNYIPQNCNKKQTCAVSVNDAANFVAQNSPIGEPCPGAPKVLTICYQCVQPGTGI